MTNDAWHTRPLAAFDLETTGLDVEADRIVTAALWRIDPARGEKACTDWLADPGIEIPEQAGAVHGITTEQARAEGRPAADVVAEIAAELERIAVEGLPLVVYNASYDLTLLDRELTRHGKSVDFIGRLRVIDPLVLDKHTDPYRRGSRRLTDVCAHHGVALDTRDAHGAAADALAAARLAWRLAAAHPDLAQADPDALHEAQRTWRAEQAASLQAYLRRTRDPEALVAGAWPIVPAP